MRKRVDGLFFEDVQVLFTHSIFQLRQCEVLDNGAHAPPNARKLSTVEGLHKFARPFFQLRKDPDKAGDLRGLLKAAFASMTAGEKFRRAPEPGGAVHFVEVGEAITGDNIQLRQRLAFQNALVQCQGLGSKILRFRG